MLNKNKKEKIEEKLFEVTAKVVIVKESEVLILRRSKNDHRYPGQYDLPGGGVEKGEAIESTILREIEEETNLKVELGPIIHAFDFDKDYNLENGEKYESFGKGLRYIAFWKSGEVKLSDEHDEFLWLPFSEAEKKLSGKFEHDKKVAVGKAREYMEMKNAVDSWKRCIADFENFKKRQAERNGEFIKFANENLIYEILPVADNFQASLSHVPENMDKDPWVTGILHIEKQLMKILGDAGVEKIKAEAGQKFDPNIHEAIKKQSENTKQMDEKEEGKIMKVIQPGYRLNGKVIRAAKVIVG